MTAYACGMCGALYSHRADADGCCTCETCKTKFPKGGYGFDCGRCAYGSQLREARRSLKRAVEDKVRAEARLADLLETKRPPAGSSP